MNIGDLLRQIVQLAPQYVQAARAFYAALPGLARAVSVFDVAVQNFIASQGGWQVILQRLAQTGIGRAVGGIAQTVAQSGVGQFAASAAGAAAGGAMRVGSAALGMIGAALASPLGQVALAAAGVAAAFVGVGVAAERAIRTMLESQRHLAESSAGMAAVFARSDVRRIMREMRAGNEQAGTAGFLARSLDSLADTLQPILSLLTNIANVVGGVVATVLQATVAPINLIVEYLKGIFELVKLAVPSFLLPDEGDPKLLSQWMEDVKQDAQRDRERGRPFSGMVFP